MLPSVAAACFHVAAAERCMRVSGWTALVVVALGIGAASVAEGCSYRKLTPSAESCAPREPWSISPHGGMGFPWGCSPYYPIEECTAHMDAASPDQKTMARFLAARGRLYLLRNDEPERAITDFDAVLRTDSSAPAYFHRAQARMKLGEHAGAVGDLDAALQLNPGDAAALGLRGKARMYTWEFKKAAEDLLSAIELTRSEADRRPFRALRAVALIKTSQEKAADDERQAALGSTPLDAAYARLTMCEAEIAHGLLKAAEVDCTEVIQSGHHVMRGHVLRGMLHLKAGRRSAALQDFDLAIARDNRSAIAHFGRCGWGKPPASTQSCDFLRESRQYDRMRREFASFGLKAG
jgi:tetratricopeptide (TPR) repeat protein